MIKNNLIPPHGGILVNRLLSGSDLNKAIKNSSSLFKIRLSSLEISDLIMIATGAFSPRAGFMNSDDYQGVLTKMKLSNNILWPIPITLSVYKKDADKISIGDEVALIDSESDELMGTILVEEKFSYNRDKEALSVFGTCDKNHPGVAKIYEKGEIYLAGPVRVFSEGIYSKKFPEYSRPKEVREIFLKLNWKSIAGFQTRNPIHRSHEYITKIILEIMDGLFIHPIVGKLKEDDIPAEIRMDCYKILINNYYPKERVLLKVYPMEMRYAGPKEAVLHAIIRQNFGCSHFIIGRDHAGVGNYYGPFEAQKIFGLVEEDLLIKPIKIDWTFWCNKCSQIASSKTCPHSEEDHSLVSGTKLREILSRGEFPPEYITRHEVADILIKYYRTKIPS
ncbi:MAG: sulfate adenylyltransferase [Actinobacteria bacterium]|nr:sulfate adenylyltransferase [Actinomycetota bacterium]